MRALLLALGACLVLASCASQPEVSDDPLAGKLILVAGASGRTGRIVIRDLQAEGLTFRSLTRDAERAVERWGDEYVDMNWVEGDVRDARRMREVMKDVDLVISVVGSRDRKGPNSAEFVDFQGVVNLVEAAREEQVGHFVLLTAIGASDPEHPLNKALGDALKWRFRGEEYLRDSGLDYTIVRPAGLVDEPANKRGVVLAQGDEWRKWKGRIIAREDLSLIFLECLRNPACDRTTFEVFTEEGVEPGAWRDSVGELQPDPSR